MSRIKDQAVAISALFLSSAQVHDYAYTGSSNSMHTEMLVRSLFNNDAQDAISIYGGTAGLGPGLELAKGLLSNTQNDNRTMEVTRYSISLMQLDKQLQNNEAMGQTLIESIDRIATSISDQEYLAEQVISQLGEAYQATLSHLQPRIMVKGDETHLKVPSTSAIIRVLLLSGLRASVLWRQSGGNRFTLLLSRKKLLNEVQTLLG